MHTDDHVDDSVFFESVLFGLTVNAMIIQDRRRSFNTLTLILYRDGMFYFIAVTSKCLFRIFALRF